MWKTKALSLACLVWTVMVGAPGVGRAQRTYYVDAVHGQDDATASRQDPLRSPASLAGRLGPGDVVILAGGRYQEPVRFTDSGTAEDPIVIRNAGDQTPVVAGATWTLEGASHVVLRGVTFEECSPGLVIGPHASDNLVDGNRFLNCPPRGQGTYQRAILGQAPNSHRNRIENNVLARPYEPINGEGPEGVNVVEGNQHWVFRGNRISGYMYGLDIGYQFGNGAPGYILVEDNEIFDCHEGIHLKASDNVIRGNHIHDLHNVGFMMCATGVFLRSSPRTTVENNRIERAGAGIRVLGHDQLIRNNLIVETAIGIWLSRHGYGAATHSHWLVHNTVVGTLLPVWLSGGSQAYVYNNILVGAPGAGPAIFVAGFTTDHPLRNDRSVFPDPEWFTHYAGATGPQEPPAHLVADHNLFYDAEPPPWLYPPAAQPPPDDLGSAAHNRRGDPMFVDAEHGDYRLRPDSPARGAGRRLPNCAYDLEGRLRPLDHPDCGAFQTAGETER